MHRFDREYVINRFLPFDNQHVMLLGNDSHISFFNLDTQFFNGSMKIDFSKNSFDIFDLQLVKKESEAKKTYMFVTNQGVRTGTITKHTIGR